MSALHKQPPSLAVFFESCAGAIRVWVEAEALVVDYVSDGEHVPGVDGDDVGDEGVYVIWGVGKFGFDPEFASIDSADGLNVVSTGSERGSAFDLHTPEARAVVENEVVALAVGPGFGDAESQAGGFEKEGGFGKVSGLGSVAFCGMVRENTRIGASSW